MSQEDDYTNPSLNSGYNRYLMNNTPFWAGEANFPRNVRPVAPRVVPSSGVTTAVTPTVAPTVTPNVVRSPNWSDYVGTDAFGALSRGSSSNTVGTVGGTTPSQVSDFASSIANLGAGFSLGNVDTSGLDKFTGEEEMQFISSLNAIESKAYWGAGGGENGFLAVAQLRGDLTPSGQPVDTGTGGGGTGGGGTGGAIGRALRDYISGVDASRTDYGALREGVSGRYADLQNRLAEYVAQADVRQQASAARAAEALAAIDPQAAFQYDATPMDIGAGSGANYLRSIGASTADVEAVRRFEQDMLNRAMRSAQQFSQGQQRALDIERAARQAAVPQMLQEAQAATTAQQLAYQLGLTETERVALENLFKEETTEGQSIADKILQARLAAAEAGVVL
jgi:hypothetical protein